jgi:TolC family type I secretion outer membrane protein
MSRISRAVRLTVAVFAAQLTLGSVSHASDFRQNVSQALQEHRLMRMVGADIATAQHGIRAEKSAWLPRASLEVNQGEHEITREQGTSGQFEPAEQTIALTQLVTDFGITSSRIRSAEAVFQKENQEAALQRQNLILAAVEAQLGLLRANEQLRYARASEANIKRQTQLESGRMEAGRGYATDVLQAKAQLAGAEARRVVSERQLQEALNRYEAVFGNRPASLDSLEALLAPTTVMPQSEADLVTGVRKDSNPDVVAAIARTDVARAEWEVRRNTELMPRVDLRLSRSYYEELDGVGGDRDDTQVMLRFNWGFDLGGRAIHSSRAAAAAVISAQEKAEYVRIQALEESRNAWINWQSARERASFLDNQVQLTGSFLELARKERDLGRRSLLDLLNGETALMNAQSEAVAARIDEVIATYRVLRAAGMLDVSVFDAPGVVVPAAQLTAPAAAATALLQ